MVSRQTEQGNRMGKVYTTSRTNRRAGTKNRAAMRAARAAWRKTFRARAKRNAG